MASLEINDDLYAELLATADDQCRTPEQQVAFMLKRQARERAQNRDRQRRYQETKRASNNVNNVSNVSGVSSPSPFPAPLSSPTPPSNPPAPTPAPVHAHEGMAVDNPVDNHPVLEEVSSGEAQKGSAAGPDLSRPATPAPKPSRRRLLGEDDPRFLEFRAAYRGPRAKGWADALTLWNANGCSSDEVFPLVMAALAEDNAAPDWVKEQGAFIPAPAVWLRRRRWLDARFAAKPTALAAAPVDTFRAYYLAGKENWTDAHVVSFWVGKINHDLEAGLDEEGFLAMLASDGLMPTLRQVDRLGREAQERRAVRHA